MNDVAKRWERARQSGPAPSGFKRCMNCYEVMPYDEYCDCLKEVGEQIRAKAKKFCDAAPKKEEKPKRIKEKHIDQGRLF